MKYLIKKIIINRSVSRKILRILLEFDNLNRSLINTISIIVEGGIHPKHRIMDYHKFFVNNISENEIVLDIGCGNGALTYDIAKKAKYVCAIDINSDNIKQAKERYQLENITFIAGDATNYKFDKIFDVIVLSNVLEHIEKRIEFLKRIKLLGSRLLIRVPMINRDWVVLYKKEFGLAYMSDANHYTEYTLESLKNELSEAGLKIENYSIQFGEIWARVSK